MTFKKVITHINLAVAQRPLVTTNGGSQFVCFFEGINHTRPINSGILKQCLLATLAQ